MGADDAPDLILCGAPAPEGSGLESCARERGHDGKPHYFWACIPHDHGFGIQVYEGFPNGAGKSRVMMEWAEPPESPKEVCVAMKILDKEF